MFRSIVVARQRTSSVVHRLVDASTMRAQVVVLWIPDAGSGERPPASACAAGVLFDVALKTGSDCLLRDDGLLFVFPRRLVSSVLQDRAVDPVVPGSTMLAALRRLATTLLRLPVLSHPQARLAGGALAELLALALAPDPAEPRLSTRRQASLLERLVAYVDAHLTDSLDVAALSRRLCCSRSALYRAAAPVGSIGSFVAQRRMTAAQERLNDPNETRSIAAIARACGFADPAAFSRAFKRIHGVTAGTYRSRRTGIPNVEVQRGNA